VKCSNMDLIINSGSGRLSFWWNVIPTFSGKVFSGTRSIGMIVTFCHGFQSPFHLHLKMQSQMQRRSAPAPNLLLFDSSILSVSVSESPRPLF
jgi:hypothetical protein